MEKVTNSTHFGSESCRILYIIGQLGCGGLERQMSYLLRAMDRQRYPSHVLVWSYSPDHRYVEEIRSLGVPIHWFPQRASRIAKLCGARRLAQSLGAEVIHSYTFHTNIAAWWATLGSTALPVGSLRGSFLVARRNTGTILGRVCARWPHAQIFNSGAAQKTAEYCATMFKPNHMYVVRNGLDLRYFSPQPFPHNVTLLAVGSLYPIKRWDRLIKIISLLSARGIQFQVRHVGDGPLRGELEELARRLGVDGLIRFLGPRNDIPELLADSFFLLHTAEAEGCPNVVMEAMACGRAVVAMDAGDIPFLVEDRKTGFVIRPGDEETFGQRVMQLLSDEELCRRMGLAAREKAEREFGLERLVAETLDVYRAAGWKDRQTLT
jgi:glycosyltransferase involved in cell wall biosynthesis